MYRKIYQILEETGKVKTAMVLNGNHKGEKMSDKRNIVYHPMKIQQISGKNMKLIWRSARRQKLFIWEM